MGPKLPQPLCRLSQFFLQLPRAKTWSLLNITSMTALALHHQAEKNPTNLSPQRILFTQLKNTPGKFNENSLVFLNIKLSINDHGLSTSVH